MKHSDMIIYNKTKKKQWWFLVLRVTNQIGFGIVIYVYVVIQL